MQRRIFETATSRLYLVPLARSSSANWTRNWWGCSLYLHNAPIVLSQASARCANISDALDVPITDPSPRTNNAPSTINTRQLPQYASLYRLCSGLFKNSRSPWRKRDRVCARCEQQIGFSAFRRTLIDTGILVKLFCTLVYVSLYFLQLFTVEYEKTGFFIAAIIIRYNSFFYNIQRI